MYGSSASRPPDRGLATGEHGASLAEGKLGVLHGAMSYVLQTEAGQIREAHSISAGLDYPATGPEHAFLKDEGLAEYASVTDEEALEALQTCSRSEGIIPALETAHALFYAEKVARELGPGKNMVVNISGRGDKDVEVAAKALGIGAEEAVDVSGAKHRPSARKRTKRPFERRAREDGFSGSGYGAHPLPDGRLPFPGRSAGGGGGLSGGGRGRSRDRGSFLRPPGGRADHPGHHDAALENGADLDYCLDLASGFSGRVPVVFLLYYNVIFARGAERFLREAADAGVSGLVIPDLPVDEAGRFAELAAEAGVAFCPLVAPTSTDERVSRVGEMATGLRLLRLRGRGDGGT